MSEEEILKRLDKIEHQLKFFAEAYTHLHNRLIQGVQVQMQREIFEPSLTHLKKHAQDILSVYKEFQDVCKHDSIQGALVYMAKKITEMEDGIEEIKEEGVKKKIVLDVKMDGYEMVRKNKNDTWEEPSPKKKRSKRRKKSK